MKNETPEIPEVTELDELETFVGSKKTKSGCGRQLITSSQGSQLGHQATGAPKPLIHCGKLFDVGNVSFM